MVKLNISQDFTIAPGARYYSDGDNSGQEFYEKILKDRYSEAIKTGTKLEINLDGTLGYPSSFLSESFGRLCLENGEDKIWDNIIFISDENPLLLDIIHKYAEEYLISNKK